MPVSNSSPAVSVVIPTYRKPDALRRCLDALARQTFHDFEVVVSDDEESFGEAWKLLQDRAARDPRVKHFRNPGPHGPIANFNHALARATGQWIKPVADTDILRPGALSRLMKAVESRRGVALVSCLADTYRDGEVVRQDLQHGRSTLERVTGESALLGMYLQDVDLGRRSQLMVHSSVVANAGVLMEERPEYVTAADVLWTARILQHGDLLLLNEAWVELHDDIQSEVPEAIADRLRFNELCALRARLRELVHPELHPPRLSAVRGQLRLIFSAIAAKQLRPIAAVSDAISVLDPAAWALAIRWALRRTFPGRFHAVPRLPVALDVPSARQRPWPEAEPALGTIPALAARGVRVA